MSLMNEISPALRQTINSSPYVLHPQRYTVLQVQECSNSQTHFLVTHEAEEVTVITTEKQRSLLQSDILQEQAWFQLIESRTHLVLLFCELIFLLLPWRVWQRIRSHDTLTQCCARSTCSTRILCSKTLSTNLTCRFSAKSLTKRCSGLRRITTGGSTVTCGNSSEQSQRWMQ